MDGEGWEVKRERQGGRRWDGKGEGPREREAGPVTEPIQSHAVPEVLGQSHLLVQLQINRVVGTHLEEERPPPHTYSHTHARTHARTHAHTHTHTDARTDTCTHMPTLARTHAHTHTHVYMYMYMYRCVRDACAQDFVSNERCGSQYT